MSVVRRAALGIGHGHARCPPLLHGDVQPANLHLGEIGRVKVLGFGRARAVGHKTLGPGASMPAYLAPEVLDEEAPSPAADVYSLGVILFQLLTGRLPIEIPNNPRRLSVVAKTVRRAHEKGLPPVSALRSGVSPTLVELTASCLSFYPEMRPATGTMLAANLALELSGTPSWSPPRRSAPARRPGPGTRGKKRAPSPASAAPRRRSAMLVAAVVVLVAAAGLLLAQSKSTLGPSGAEKKMRAPSVTPPAVPVAAFTSTIPDAGDSRTVQRTTSATTALPAQKGL